MSRENSSEHISELPDVDENEYIRIPRDLMIELLQQKLGAVEYVRRIAENERFEDEICQIMNEIDVKASRRGNTSE